LVSAHRLIDSSPVGIVARIVKVLPSKVTSCIEAEVMHNASPEQPEAELIAISFGDDQMGQQRYNLGRVEVIPCRHAARSALGEPVSVEVEVK
jgi:hypothetical protein